MKRTVIFFLTILLIGSYVSYQVLKIHGDKSSRLKILDTIPLEYSRLFEVKVGRVTGTKSYVLYNTNISPISTFTYDDKYWIVITKLKTKKLDSLPNVNVKYGKALLTDGEVYAGFEEGYFHLDILPDSNIVSKLTLVVNSKLNNHIFKSKDLMAYYTKLKSISVIYNDHKKINLNVESLADGAQSCVVFLKHEQSLYFIFVSAADSI